MVCLILEETIHNLEAALDPATSARVAAEWARVAAEWARVAAVATNSSTETLLTITTALATTEYYLLKDGYSVKTHHAHVVALVLECPIFHTNFRHSNEWLIVEWKIRTPR